MPGPGKKPTHLKAVAGTERKDRVIPDAVELPLVSDVPAAPDWLPNAHSVLEWNRLAPILTANKLLTEAGCSSLAVLCSLHGKIVQLFAAGECPTGHMLAQYRNLVNDFGLTPVAQGKVKPQQSKEDSGNPFARNGKRAS
jgi:phage terminase small subunit